MESAGVRVIVLPLMVAPFTLEETLIDPTEITPEAAAHVGNPPANVKTCASVPLANLVPVPEVPP